MSLTAEYANPIYNGSGCGCKAHRLHRVFRFYWNHPSASRKAAAQALKLTPNNVYEAFWRLRHRDLSCVCPECFEPRLLNGVCQGCGFEPFEPVLPLEIMADSQHPVNALHPGNMLGSEMTEADYQAIGKAYGFTNRGLVLKRKIDRVIETPLVDAVRSDVGNSLDGGATPETTEEAGRLVLKEVAEFLSHYPGLRTSKLARAELTRNVLARLRLLHPTLNLRVLEGDGHE